MQSVAGKGILFRHGFLFGLLGAVVLAFLFPEWGAKDGPLRAGRVAQAGVFLIFFLQGLSLRTQEMLRGFGNLRLHSLVQAWIFLVGAAFLLAVAFFLRRTGTALAPLADGFIFLALLPTTISSAVAFTATAGGNTAGAIVNTTFANIVGVFWVPAGCLLFFATGEGLQAEMVAPLLLKLGKLILLPLLCGHLVRPLVRESPLYRRLQPGFRPAQNAAILFIVFASFSQSLRADMGSEISPLYLGGLLSAVILSLLFLHRSLWLVSGWLLTAKEDRVTALFCGAQRTLAAGAPMALAIFGGKGAISSHDPGMILLPLLCYHPLQLFLAGMLLPILRCGRPTRTRTSNG